MSKQKAKIMSTKSKLKTEREISDDNQMVSASIFLTIELETNFKLYSYRVINKELFVERVNELLHIFQEQTKSKLPVFETGEKLDNYE